jgi:glutamate 5-kinase
VVLVSSGAIAAGLAPLGLARRPRDLGTLQAAASVGQSALVQRYADSFARYGLVVGQVLLTPEDVVRRGRYRNAHTTLLRLLDLGAVPVVNENDTVATDEIRFGDNDRLAALVTHLVRADLLVLLSDVDGLYDTDPRHPGARLIDEVRGEADLADVDLGGAGSSVGTGGMATKIAAARAATAAGVAVVLTSAPNVGAALAGDPVGTLFHAHHTRRPSAGQLWLRYATQGRGRLHVDAGAVAALVHRGTSLLPAGVVSVEGRFEAGDPVDVVGPDGALVARGLVGYDARELPRLLGRSTHDLRAELGEGWDREVIHRDDLVLVHRGQRRTG